MCNFGSNTFSCYSDKYAAEEAKLAMLRYDANSEITFYLWLKVFLSSYLAWRCSDWVCGTPDGGEAE